MFIVSSRISFKLALCVAVGSLAGCVSQAERFAHPSANDTSEPKELRRLSEIKGRSQSDMAKDESVQLRAESLKQEALRVGAQSGLAYRYGMLMDYCDSVEPKINVVWNLSQFVRDVHLLIPAVIEVRDQFTKEGGEIRRVRTGITVTEEADVISSTPTWRDYVYQRYDVPDLPHESLYPLGEVEESIWKSALKQGWEAGIFQADANFQDRVNQLTRAVEGRYQYLTLEARGMFTPADLKVVNSQVTFQGRTMNVGEQIITVRNQGNFTQMQTWAPVWTR